MVFCRDIEFTVTTKFPKACVTTKILCRNRARSWDSRGARDRARDHAHGACDNVHSSCYNMQCARSCALNIPTIVYYVVQCLGYCPWALLKKKYKNDP